MSISLFLGFVGWLLLAMAAAVLIVFGWERLRPHRAAASAPAEPDPAAVRRREP
jgi:hypothetical protein